MRSAPLRWPAEIVGLEKRFDTVTAVAGIDLVIAR